MKIESNKNWTTCLRLNTGDGSPRVFLLNSHFLGSVPILEGVLLFSDAISNFAIHHIKIISNPFKVTIKQVIR